MSIDLEGIKRLPQHFTAAIDAGFLVFATGHEGKRYEISLALDMLHGEPGVIAIDHAVRLCRVFSERGPES